MRDFLLEKAADSALKAKSEKSGIPVGILRQVYNRGLAAWKTGHRPGATQQQWGYARVNSFITKGKGTWGKADADLAAKARASKSKKESVQEKLGPDADAGDYIKDFRKSKAPQFKGKTDKEKQKMAVAAFLARRDKKESVEEARRAPKVDLTKYAKHMAKNDKKKKLSSTQRSLADIRKRSESVDRLPDEGTDKASKRARGMTPGQMSEGSETWEAGYKRRVVKTTKPEHKEKGYNWRIKGKDRPEISIKLYKEKPSQQEFNKQMKRVAGHEFGG